MRTQRARVLFGALLFARILSPAPARASALDAAVISLDADAAARDGVAPDVLRLALTAVSNAVSSGAMKVPDTLSIIDYSRPSVEPRLWVYDLATGDLLFKELVAHGRNTGGNMATSFSNEMNSLKSSLGLFVAGAAYVGSNGYSLRLDGLDRGFNDHARDRAIVVHGAAYVDPKLATANRRIGRSWGCPALRPAVSRQLIDRIRDGGAIFAYYPDPKWLASSRFLRGATTG